MENVILNILCVVFVIVVGGRLLLWAMEVVIDATDNTCKR